MHDKEIRGFAAALDGPENYFRSLWRRIPRHILITFVSAFVLGFLIHGFMFANKFLNHDDIGHLFGSNYGVASGRWLLPAVLSLDGELSMPWLIGILSLLLLSLSACLTVSVLRIKSTLSCVLTAAVMVAFPTVGATFAYMFSADAYFLSLLMACLAAYLTVKYRFGFIGGIALIALSMGIYQSYFGVAAVMLVAALILETLDDKLDLKQLILRAFKFLGTLVLGLALYYIIVKITTRSTGLVDYMGISSMGSIHLSDIPGRVLSAYKSYHNLFEIQSPGISQMFLLVVVGILLLAFAVLAISLLRTRRLKAPKLALLAVLVLLFPVAGALIYVMTVPSYVHQLMIYGLCYLLLAPLALYEYRRALPKSGSVHLLSILAWAVAISLALVSFNYAVFTNESYMKMQLAYTQTEAYSNRLLSAIERLEGYDENATIVLVGNAYSNAEEKSSVQLYEIQMTGALNTESIINNYTYGHFLKYYMGVTNTVISYGNPLPDDLTLDDDFDSMPCYPSEGGIAWIDGYIVVNLGEELE